MIGQGSVKAREEADAAAAPGGEPPAPDAAERLFRHDAVSHAAPGVAQRDGAIFISTPPKTFYLGAVVAALILVAAGVAIALPYSRTERSRGWLVPPAGLVRVTSARPGVVARVSVKEGDAVKAGRPLVWVTHPSDTSRGNTGTEMLRQFDAEQRSLEQTSRSDEDDLTQRESSLRQRIAILSRQIAADDRQIAIAEQQLQLAVAGEDRANKLREAGYLSQAGASAARTAVLQAEAAVADRKSGRITSEMLRDEAATQLAQISSGRLSALAQRERAAADLEQRRLNAVAERESIGIAPLAGAVVGLPKLPGSTVAAGDTLAVVSLGEGPLVGEIFVSQRAAGLLKAGQAVRLNLDAFPYQTFGSVPGHILSISPTALTSGEIGVPGVRAEDAMYRVRVRLERSFVNAYGQRRPLSPGMSLEAIIVTDRRSLIEWLLDPVFAVQSASR
ncbi:HlyD family efflux transporter periplasmic adaptor subunit [Brevundimonas sp. BR2-1]|uniref:HlyD family efflux transporter periplasmic adaptor subunit n=1 Tax=Brevundimonas sp. BR2-1 TaxID=3031123 RepID=UPI0030A004E3